MTRNSMKLVISDHEVSDVQMALAREHHDRRGAFQNLQAHGHVRILDTEDPARIHVQIEDEVLHDERARFPTTVLMAKLQLAIAAGRSCRNVNWDRDDDPYAKAEMAFAAQRRLLQYDARWDNHLSLAKRVTATVKKAARGLRP